ncbi:DUF2163 domain-containing protein [Allopontixanthobacter sp.]|uniref:DUF2163 domain-containing protein n=1 Tax=Allopontixanthobacter sp. TaxID=2906452 RepID=UPI002ABBA442|nr:DUF2163 domain-containing protein [Allopontixanthobacter sp.]MDZ4308364.1 DUF2163 domain-containing protein [Allopontixanthobacter sp.]
MSRIFFAQELEGVATFWRIHRRDGVTLGFTSHNRDLWFGGILHRAAPGMVPSAIRRTADLSPDSTDVTGALGHDSISAADLALGRFDNAQVQIGAVDWETLEFAALYNGSIRTVSAEGGSFSAELRSAKSELELDFIPRTSPTCRAQFCGKGCTLSLARFAHEAALGELDLAANTVRFEGIDAPLFAEGEIRWVDGPQAGVRMLVIEVKSGGLALDVPLDPGLAPGTRAILTEGCDHTLAVCSTRFGNAVNFQGEPFLPGNDLLARYPSPS